MTTIHLVRSGWTEQYGLYVYELVGRVGNDEFRKTLTVSESVYTSHKRVVETHAREQLTEQISKHYKETA
ncbi:hypothetical protein DF152_17300 [Burkholderia cenocepacia]|nr:hypothetical protein DF152_17300 [Burkholderia cenocepacia]